MYRWLFVLEESGNGSFRFEVNPHQFNLRLHNFSQFPVIVKKKISKVGRSVIGMSWYMDLRQPRVCRHSNISLAQIRAFKFSAQGSTLIFSQLGSRTTIKQYWLVRNRNLLGHNDDILFFSCNQAAYRTLLPVCLSVTPFSLCSHHHIITKFSGVITIGRRDVHAKGQGQWSKVKVTWEKKTQFLTQIGRFRTVTPVWIYQWLRNDAQSLK